MKIVKLNFFSYYNVHLYTYLKIFAVIYDIQDTKLFDTMQILSQVGTTFEM